MTLRQPLTPRIGMTTAVVIVLVLIAVAVFGWQANPWSKRLAADGAQAGTALPVAVKALERQSGYNRHMAYTGVVRAERTSELGFDGGGRLVEILFDEGDLVELGQVIARIDSRKLQAKRDELSAQLREAEALYAEAQNGPRAQTVDAARARVAELAASCSLAELEYRRATGLRSTNAVSAQDLDRAQFSWEGAKARMESAQQDLAELEAGTRPERLTAAEATVDRLQASLSDLEVQIADCELVAPYSGCITRRHIHEGTIVTPGTPIIALAETSALEVRIGLPTDLAELMVAGERRPLLIRGEPWNSTVRERLPQLDEVTRTQTVVFELDPPSPEKPAPALSELARLELELPVSREGYWIPLTAMTRGPRGLWSIYVVETSNPSDTQATSTESRVSRVEVELLHADDDRAFVRGPLSSGMQLIEDGPHRVVAGQRVSPTSGAAD